VGNRECPCIRDHHRLGTLALSPSAATFLVKADQRVRTSQVNDQSHPRVVQANAESAGGKDDLLGSPGPLFKILGLFGFTHFGVVTGGRIGKEAGHALAHLSTHAEHHDPLLSCDSLNQVQHLRFGSIFALTDGDEVGDV